MLMTANKDETAVHGYHCRGNKAVHMLKVLAILRSQTANCGVGSVCYSW